MFIILLLIRSYCGVWYPRHSQVFDEKEWNSTKMFGFVNRILVSAIMFFGCNLSSVNPLECVLMKNEECKVRTETVNVNNNEPVLYPFSIKTSKCSGSCNNTHDTYAKLSVPDVVKNMNIKVFNLMSRNNKTRHIKWHETCKFDCRLDAYVCNNNQRWNDDKCRYECKEVIEKGICDRGFIWNPSNCQCECDKSCDVGEYFDYEKCKCRNVLKMLEKQK